MDKPFKQPFGALSEPQKHHSTISAYPQAGSYPRLHSDDARKAPPRGREAAHATGGRPTVAGQGRPRTPTPAGLRRASNGGRN